MTNEEEYRARKAELANVVNVVADEQEADVLLFNAAVSWNFNKPFTDIVRLSRPRKNVLLILVTNGGDADAGYKMARCLQRIYCNGTVTALIPSVCKSAGTLVTVGAHRLVIGDKGELGPLDVQLRKRDELFEHMSGLDVDEALISLQEKSFKTFEEQLLTLNISSGGAVSLKTAMQVATELTVGLFKPIYEQIDPLRVGEIAREIKIAYEYGKRLNAVAKNLKDGALDRLIASYPSHGFVIDRKEGEELFVNIREPNHKEQELLEFIDAIVRQPLSKPLVQVISTDLVTLEQQNESNRNDSAGETAAAKGTPAAEAGNITPITIVRTGN